MVKKCGIDDWNPITKSRTTSCCQELATMEVHDLSGKVIAKACPFHAKQTELIILGVHGYIRAKYFENN